MWEWVAESYGGARGAFRDYAVARGGCYDSATEEHFFSSYRNLQPADTRDTIFGFRVVLAEKGRELE